MGASAIRSAISWKPDRFACGSAIVSPRLGSSRASATISRLLGLEHLHWQTSCAQHGRRPVLQDEEQIVRGTATTVPRTKTVSYVVRQRSRL